MDPRLQGSKAPRLQGSKAPRVWRLQGSGGSGGMELCSDFSLEDFMQEFLTSQVEFLTSHESRFRAGFSLDREPLPASH